MFKYRFLIHYNFNIMPFFYILVFFIVLLSPSLSHSAWLGVSFQDVTIISPEQTPKPISRTVLAAGKSPVDISISRWGNISPGNSSLKTIITGVVIGSPADAAGFKVSDEILAIQGKDISTRSQIPTIIGPLLPGAEITIEIRRQEDVFSLQAVLGSADSFTKNNQQIIEHTSAVNRHYSQGRFEDAIVDAEKLVELYSRLWGKKSQALIDTNVLLSTLYAVNNDEDKRQVKQNIVLGDVEEIYGSNSNIYKQYHDLFEKKTIAREIRKARENSFTGVVSWAGNEVNLKNGHSLLVAPQNYDLNDSIHWALTTGGEDYFVRYLRLRRILSAAGNTTIGSVYEDIHDPTLVSHLSFYLDDSIHAQNLLEEAIEAESDPQKIAETYNLLAGMYSLRGETDSERTLLSKFELFTDENKKINVFSRAMYLAEISMNYFSLMDLPRAKKLYNKSILTVKKSNNNELDKARKILEICEQYYYVNNEISLKELESLKCIFEKNYEISRLELARTLRKIAWLKNTMQKPIEEIQSHYEKSIDIILGLDPIPGFDLMQIMSDYADFYISRGNVIDGLKIKFKSLILSKIYYGTLRPDLLSSIARTLQQIDQDLSEKLLTDALKISKEVYGENKIQTATSIINLAIIYNSKINMSDVRNKVEKLYKNYLDIVLSICGEKSRMYKGALQQIASFYNSFDKNKAKELIQQANNLNSKKIEKDELSRALTKEGYANNLIDIEGDYIQALKIYEETVSIKGKILGESDIQYKSSLGTLAWLYQITGDYSKAIEIYKSMNDQLRLAGVYLALGEYQRVLSVLNQYEIQNKDQAERPMTKATLLETKADSTLRLGRYQEAAEYYQLSLDALKVGFPGVFVDSIPSIGTGKLYGLAESYEGLGEFDKAEYFYKKVLEYEKAGPAGLYGSEGLVTAEHMVGLAGFYNRLRRWDYAAPLLEQSLSILSNNLGKKHPAYPEALSEQSIMYASQGLTNRAFNKQAEALVLLGGFVDQLATWADESRLQTYAKKMEDNYDLLYSLIGGNFPGSEDEIKHALELHLNYKGRIMEVLSTRARFAVLSQNPTVSNLIEDLRLTTARISQLQLNPPKLEADKLKLKMETLEEKRQQLEESLASQSAEFAKIRATSAVTVTELLDALPPNSVYIDFVDYRKFDYERDKWTDDRYYLAFLVKAGDDGQANVTIKDLGTTKAINEMVKRLRHEIAGGGAQQRGVAGVRPVIATNKSIGDSSKNTTPAEALYGALFSPMEEEILNAQTIFIAPSGNLNLIPLELSSKPASNRPLSDDYEFIYCLGKDLVNQKQGKVVEKKHLEDNWVSIVAAPNFSDPREASMQDNVLQQSVIRPLARGDVNGWPVIFESLPGTMKEADTIQSLAEASTKVIKMTGGDATETAFKSLHRPSVLHVATHGFFLEAPREFSRIGIRGVGGVRKTDDEKILSSPQRLLNPSLRSGLALAGANRLAENKLVPEGEDDGILMAAEVVWMDLFGTDLVVLSACDTGLGEVQRGEGVFGLRRAFKIAGAKNILMSLWSVPDKETAWLMEAFYKNYFKGKSPASALKGARKTVRKRLIKRDGIDNPFYWGAFVLEGTGL